MREDVRVALDRVILFRLATSSRFERAVRIAPGGERAAWRGASRYVAGTSAADAFAASYVRLAEDLAEHPPSVWLAVDLSHLGLDVDAERCADHLAAAAAALPPGRRIQVGAEDHTRTDAVLGCVLDVAGRGFAR